MNPQLLWIICMEYMLPSQIAEIAACWCWPYAAMRGWSSSLQ